jgi:hypothetical protein
MTAVVSVGALVFRTLAISPAAKRSSVLSEGVAVVSFSRSVAVGVGHNEDSLSEVGGSNVRR